MSNTNIDQWRTGEREGKEKIDLNTYLECRGDNQRSREFFCPQSLLLLLLLLSQQETSRRFIDISIDRFAYQCENERVCVEFYYFFQTSASTEFALVSKEYGSDESGLNLDASVRFRIERVERETC